MLLLFLLTAAELRAAEPPAWQPQLERYVEQLSSDWRRGRERATGGLAGLLLDPERRADVAAQLRIRLHSQPLDVEGQLRVLGLLSRFDLAAPDAPLDALGEAETAAWLAKLSHDDYAVRRQAAQRLAAELARPERVCALLEAFRRTLATKPRAAEWREHLLPLYDRARERWLSLEPRQWRLPEAPAEQVERWLDELAGLVSAADADEQADRQATAQRALADLMFRDAYLPALRAGLEAREAAADTSPAARARVRALYDACRPMMVAEYWSSVSNREAGHEGIQYLYVGVPQFPEGAARGASHFDPVDEQRAHCVAGNSLKAGEDYPMNVAVPHPVPLEQPGFHNPAFFHLRYLPTPLRRRQYEAELQREDGVRLAELTRRTLQAALREKRPLDSDGDQMVLPLLDAKEVSKFAGDYFAAVDDRQIPLDEFRPRFSASRSMHGSLCLLLANRGTQEAVPGLEKALADKRFSAPNEVEPYQIGWLAILSIARRDPWPEIDAWLAAKAANETLLLPEAVEGPEVGATAAALLLERHGQPLENFGLVRDGRLNLSQTPVYRFAAAGDRAKVLEWWRSKGENRLPPAP